MLGLPAYSLFVCLFSSQASTTNSWSFTAKPRVLYLPVALPGLQVPTDILLEQTYFNSQSPADLDSGPRAQGQQEAVLFQLLQL